jgi:hypothetical protein
LSADSFISLLASWARTFVLTSAKSPEELREIARKERSLFGCKSVEEELFRRRSEPQADFMYCILSKGPPNGGIRIDVRTAVTILVAQHAERVVIIDLCEAECLRRALKDAHGLKDVVLASSEREAARKLVQWGYLQPVTSLHGELENPLQVLVEVVKAAL